MKKILLLLMCSFSVSIMSQEVCESPEEAELDLNSISVTKCTIKESKNKNNKKSRQITVKVSANRRYLKKREAVKKQKTAGLSDLGVASIENTVQSSEITKSISLKNNIKDIKNKLSAEELRKASKFSTVDKIPLFNSCKKAKKGERIDCFNQEMVTHISKHFRYPSDAIKESIQGEVWVRFIIDKNGEVKNIKTLGPKNGQILNQEAVRVVSKLPQFIPAKKDGGRISVKYGFPISFALEE
ncbi:energy transducer TonB [Tenacibaculum soleae]|uniref:energy transducer TonB n=1 Tax=Tenacibaculum soleae TaxID=447689 RepID=UPI0026E346C1|nr:energy transducer TonB [Tenacibaculum soleae]MDO6743031.1 energy transducer TonB [Tenacibaculum soleae]MDO6811426.1 energy transducer TonB [Tenacibaculum soleae]